MVKVIFTGTAYTRYTYTNVGKTPVHIKIKMILLAVVIHVFIPTTVEEETEGSQ